MAKSNLRAESALGNLIAGYQEALAALNNPNDDTLTALVKVALVRGYERELAAQGVTVGGGFGHA